uniref:PH domain-containing protein n=1 Tax=Strigamia maritima TaxID=126957 RepID=T1J1R1_STRMM
MRHSSASEFEMPMEMPSPSASTRIIGIGDGGEIMWGRLVVMGKAGVGCGEQRVIVKVYRTSLEHFAIVYPDKSVANPCGCLNLKNSRVEPVDNCDCSFRVVHKSCDVPAIQFRAESEEKRNVWLSAMYSEVTRTNSHGSISLPVVVEEDEEE